MSKNITVLCYAAMGAVLTVSGIGWRTWQFWAILAIMGVSNITFSFSCYRDDLKTLTQVVRCHECANRHHCPIRKQCLGDEGYCSLGKSEED